MNNKIFVLLSVFLTFAAIVLFFISDTKNKKLTKKPVLPTAEEVVQKKDIILESPAEGAGISSPLTITGKARGSWFFEANFPVILTDWDGKIISQTFAAAEGEWMTEEFIPFKATIEFEKPGYGERGSLILKKANPSGLSENDDALEITVFF